VKDVSPSFWRTQAMILTVKSSRILLINSYFPTDPGTVVCDESDLLETLQSIRQVIDENNFDQIYWLGDINADFVRKTGHVKCVENFVNEYQLIKAWDNFHVDFTHFQDNGDVTHTSTVDQIFWNEAVDKVIDAGVIHIPENLSDHCPVYCVVDIGTIPLCDNPGPRPTPPKPNWKRATPDQKLLFKTELENALSVINFPEMLSNCQDVHCDDPSHSEKADDLIIQVLQCVEKNMKRT
jgi:hypothetical protein